MGKLFLTEDQLKTMLDAAAPHPRDHAILHIFLSTGLRVSDVIGLRLDQVITREGAVARRIVVRQQKTGRTVEVVLNEAARHALRRYLVCARPRGPYVFPGRLRMNPMTRSNMWHIIRRYLLLVAPREAIHGNNCHALRRSMANIVATRTGRIEAASVWLGHSSVACTMAYLDKGELSKLAYKVIDEVPWARP